MRPKGQIFDLRQFRRDHGLSQKQVSEAVKRPQSFLSAIEYGRRSAPAALLDELSHLYDVDNISDYLSDPPVEAPGSVEDVRNAIVNSPGGTVLVNEFGDKLTNEEIKRILDIEEAAWKPRLTERDVEKEPLSISSPGLSSPQTVCYTSTVAELVRLLVASETRNRDLDARLKELEKRIGEFEIENTRLKNENLALREKLPKRRK